MCEFSGYCLLHSLSTKDLGPVLVQKIMAIKNILSRTFENIFMFLLEVFTGLFGPDPNGPMESQAKPNMNKYIF